MKRFLLFIALLAAASCSLVDGPMSMGSSKGRRPSRNGSKDIQVSPNLPSPDTIIYLSALSFPEDYDWARDSGVGNVKADILLFRNCEKVLSVPVGGLVSPDADRHHVVSGHLITQFNKTGRLELGMDGGRLFSYAGEGELRGLLFWGTTIYSLVALSNGGFTLRKDNEVLISRNSGYIFGSLNDQSYPETGALYMDGSSLVFCYAELEDGSWRHFSYADGRAEEEPGPEDGSRAFDMKRHDGKSCIVKEIMNGYRWSPNSRIWNGRNGLPVICGDVQSLSGGEWCSMFMDTYDYGMTTIGPPEGELYVSADGIGFCHIYDREGSTRLYRNGMQVLQPEGLYSYISPLCTALAGSTPVLVLSPREGSASPYVLIGNKCSVLDFCGFFTSVRTTINSH